MLVDAHGPSRPDDVWRRFTTPGTWHTWAHLIQGVECSDDVLAEGSTGTVHGPGGVPVGFTVTAIDADLRSWSWTVGVRFAEVAMDHFVLPAPGGGARAVLRVPGRSSAVLQPYRLPATRALRRLVDEPAADERAGDDGLVEDVRVFDFAFASSYAAAGRAFGITPSTASVEVGPQWLYIAYGPWRLVTPVDNVASAEITSGFAWIKTAGPPHLSLEDRGISFTTNGERALCLTFHEPVPSIDPTATITHPGATISVADPEGLAEALGLEV